MYLAERTRGGLVALKTPHAVHLNDATLRARFAEEVAFSRRLVPFCTASVVEDGTDRDRPYLVTEYIPGPALSQVVMARGPLTPDVAYGVALGVAAALVAVHEAGLVHRDLKPGNVLLSPHGPRVIDFGIARDVDTLAAHTQAGQVMGSPGWVAPERLTGGTAMPASDVFAWGCLVAFAATGHHPFGGGEADVLTRRILFDAPRTENVPALLRPAVEAALAKDPADRPKAADLLRALLAAGGVGAPWDLRQSVTGVLAEIWTPIPYPPGGGRVRLARPSGDTDSGASGHWNDDGPIDPDANDFGDWDSGGPDGLGTRGAEGRKSSEPDGRGVSGTKRWKVGGLGGRGARGAESRESGGPDGRGTDGAEGGEFGGPGGRGADGAEGGEFGEPGGRGADGADGGGFGGPGGRGAGGAEGWESGGLGGQGAGSPEGWVSGGLGGRGAGGADEGGFGGSGAEAGSTRSGASGRRRRAKAGAHLSHASFAALATVTIAAVTVIAAASGDGMRIGGGSLLPGGNPATVQPYGSAGSTARPTASPTGGVPPTRAGTTTAASPAAPTIFVTHTRTKGPLTVLSPSPDRNRSTFRPTNSSDPGEQGEEGPGECASPAGRKRGSAARRDCPQPSHSISTIPQDGPGESPDPSSTVSPGPTETSTGSS
ncbi:hypothetical protein GCM10022419_031140 [Nonomuraea rosea]|uniref:Protein kinase domain-containing protein n=1 Tax=Nonomuraea rosea TaxID=638574 RepID=A0ABP6WDT4_9ACTN